VLEATFIMVLIHQKTLNQLGTRTRHLEENLGVRKPETRRERWRRILWGPQ
jgi:hypothetical protein